MTLVSQYDGTCKKCNKAWKVGESIYYQKEPKCICIDSQCFESQKAGTTTSSNQTPIQQDLSRAKITRPTDERASDLGVFIATAANAKIALTGADIALVWCRL